jgi:hypothetical protein
MGPEVELDGYRVAVGETPSLVDWVFGRIRLTCLGESEWLLRFWDGQDQNHPQRQADMAITAIGTGTNRTFLYAPAPDGFVMITFAVLLSGPAYPIDYRYPVLVPKDSEVWLREKLQLRQVG